MNEGVIFGAFKGLIFNAAQLSLVTYPAVYLANTNNSDNKYMSFLTSFTILDAIFYPLDLLKTALYADTLGKFCMLYSIQPSEALLDTSTSLTSTLVFLSS